eukprot:TRINITY_DN17_c0_g1_i1.p2 TRINITY_DN17_c0_g1~~TRINITY_DN17_c0_g1_i1.p2  ORF type:complete len:296 (-),score=61.35 TRINITY_DN17_c0_g1_i1:109-996(-)
MRVLLALFLVAFALGTEYIVDQAYIDYLRGQVTWEVADYEENIFRGWTIDEVKELLIPEEVEALNDIPSAPVLMDDDVDMSDIDWSEKPEKCVHEIRNQGRCGSCWAFAVASMVSDRCCLRKKDEGWLSPQELVTCDRRNFGCGGGIRDYAIDYVVRNGLVHDRCYPYIARREPRCPSKCKDGKNFKGAHVCKCKKRINCVGVAEMRKCLEGGPISTGFFVYRDFMNYKGGIYHWDKKGPRMGGHAVKCIGYGSSPEPHWKCHNSWSTNWGEKGTFKIGTGECGIDTRQPGFCDP